MTLRTKLLLGVGILLLAMMVIIYIVPALFIRKEVYNAATEIHSLLIDDRQQLIRSQQHWLENSIYNEKQNNDALLLMIFEEPTRFASIQNTALGSDYELWIELAHVIGFDPTIGFLQAHSPNLSERSAKGGCDNAPRNKSLPSHYSITKQGNPSRHPGLKSGGTHFLLGPSPSPGHANGRWIYPLSAGRS